MQLKALIFDVDGPLAETEELHRRAFNENFAAFDVNRYWPDHERSWQWDEETYARLLKTTGGKERIAQYLSENAAINPAPWKSQPGNARCENNAFRRTAQQWGTRAETRHYVVNRAGPPAPPQARYRNDDQPSERGSVLPGLFRTRRL